MKRLSRFAVVLFQMIVCALWGLRASAHAQTTLWEIGKFDQSSAEFGARTDFVDPSYNPIFLIGQSTAEKDWPARQPGSENKDLGGRAHPYTIVFNLAGPPRGVYRLIISALLVRPRVPSLLVKINGKSGLFFFNRKLSYYPGEDWSFSPIYGGDQLEIALPVSALRVGENKLVLTAMDDPRDGSGDSVLTYDALRLTQEPPGKLAATPQVTVEPTVLYTQKDDRLYEQTYVTVTLPQRVRTGDVTLTIGKQKFTEKLSSERDFGQQRFDFAIPELTGKTPALVTLRLNGRTRRFPVVLEPKRKWTLFLVPNVHLDIGYTDYQPKAAEIHSRNLDKLLQEVRRYPEMRFSLDGSLIVEHYLATRGEAAHKEFFQAARKGEVSVPIQTTHLLTGYATLETLIRSAYYSHWLYRKYGIPFAYANITDVPSYSWSYASILNALGVKHFAAASNSDRAPIIPYGRWNEKSPFWWQGLDGEKVLMAYTRQYSHLSSVFGRPPQLHAGRQSIPVYLEAFESPDYKPDAILMYGSQADNADLLPGVPVFVKDWNSQYAYPKLVLATFPDYFRYIERNFGSLLETVVGDGGPYWEDGIGADAWYAAIDRSNQQRATSAEKLSTIAAYLHEHVVPPLQMISNMWSHLVAFSEHTWTYWGSYSRPESEQSVRQLATKDLQATNGQEAVNALMAQSQSQLADQIHMPAPAGVVFNSLNWTRSGLVETDIDSDMAILEYPSMTPVPMEILREEPDYKRVRFLARDVPSFGYRCYRVVSTREHQALAGQSEMPASSVLENSFYRVEVDPASGAVTSLLDKQLNRELVDAGSPFRLNQYLYVAGGDETATQIVYLQKSLPLAKLTISASGDGRITRVRRTSYGQILTVQSRGLHAPSIETDVILYDTEKKIEFINRLQKEPARNKEAVYFAFPFAIENPTFNYEIQNGWVDPSRNMLKGAGLEWFNVQHWVKVADSGMAIGLVPIDAHLVTLGDINRGTWPQDFEPKSATVFSYVINNYWHTNYPRVQSGNYTFRYALTSGRDLRPEFLARFGREAMTPLELDQLLETDKFGNPERPLQPAPTSFLELDAANVVVETWKGAEDGQGTILRLLEVGGGTATARLHFPHLKLERAWLANAVEENREELKVAGSSVEVPVKPHAILTLRIIASKLL